MGLGLTYELFFSGKTNFGLNTFNLKICNTTCSLNEDYSTAFKSRNNFYFKAVVLICPFKELGAEKVWVFLRQW